MYSLFMSYMTRFSEVFSYIIELIKKNMRQSNKTLQYVPTYKVNLKSEQ